MKKYFQIAAYAVIAVVTMPLFVIGWFLERLNDLVWSLHYRWWVKNIQKITNLKRTNYDTRN